jgi:hypothetical protein
MFTFTASTNPTPSSGSGTPPSSWARSSHKLSNGGAPPPLFLGLFVPLLLFSFLLGVPAAFLAFGLAESASVLWSAAAASEGDASPPAVAPLAASDPARPSGEMHLARLFSRGTPLRVRDPPSTRRFPESESMPRKAFIVIVCGCATSSSALPRDQAWCFLTAKMHQLVHRLLMYQCPQHGSEDRVAMPPAEPRARLRAAHTRNPSRPRPRDRIKCPALCHGMEGGTFFLLLHGYAKTHRRTGSDRSSSRRSVWA